MAKAENKRRSNCGEKSVRQYDPKGQGFATAITDALADIRHLCDEHGLDYAKLDRMAQDHYEAEKA